MKKKNFSFILLYVLILLLISGCTPGSYYEDKLYSEKTFSDYNTGQAVDQDSDILTREKAVQKVIGIFDKGLGKKIDRSNFSESIKLYRDSWDTAFKWQINWTEPSTGEKYTSVVDSSNGDILSINITNPASDGAGDNSNVSSEPKLFLKQIDRAEVLKIISPLITALKINLNPDSFALEPVWLTDTEAAGAIGYNKDRPLYYDGQVNVIVFYSGIRKKYSNILIDYKNKKVLSYSNDKSALKGR